MHVLFKHTGKRTWGSLPLLRSLCATHKEAGSWRIPTAVSLYISLKIF